MVWGDWGLLFWPLEAATCRWFLYQHKRGYSGSAHPGRWKALLGKNLKSGIEIQGSCQGPPPGDYSRARGATCNSGSTRSKADGCWVIRLWSSHQSNQSQPSPANICKTGSDQGEEGHFIRDWWGSKDTTHLWGLLFHLHDTQITTSRSVIVLSCRLTAYLISAATKVIG